MNSEPLDFCRVKKLHEKGFGFLQSLYYKEDIFFHFSKIKDPEVKEKFSNLERGKIYLYFTSVAQGEKRKVNRIWLAIKNVPRQLIDQFVDRIILEFNEGKTNPYELAFVVKELIANKMIGKEKLKRIILSNKVLRIPSIILAFIDEEHTGFQRLKEIIENEIEKDKPFPAADILNILLN